MNSHIWSNESTYISQSQHTHSIYYSTNPPDSNFMVNAHEKSFPESGRPWFGLRN